jgi:aminoglycoside 6-adenylyltransferase
MITKIINWAQKESAVRSILLTGSRASKDSKIDTFSDYDIAFFVTGLEKFTSDDSWFSKFGTVLVHIPETIHFNEHAVPVRLIIYENGIGADISLWKVNILEKLVAEKEASFCLRRRLSNFA